MKLSKDEINKILATELMGWEIHNDNEYLYFKPNSNDAIIEYAQKVRGDITGHKYQAWNPHENIEQAWLCEGKLPENNRTAYLGNLMEITTGYEDWDNASWENMFQLVHASASQRCEAIVKTIGTRLPA